MKRFVLFSTVCLALLLSVSAFADQLPQMVRGHGDVLYGQPINTAAAKQDTVYMLGGPGTFNGKFENMFGVPEWHGWTSIDWTYSPNHYWSVTDNPALVCGAGSRSLWVGTYEYYDPPSPGYGNNWGQQVLFTYTVNPSLVSNMQWQFTICYDSEPGYDGTYAEYNLGGTWVQLAYWDGNGTALFDQLFSYNSPADYAGPLGNQIQLRIRFTSDGAWSDQDGLWPTIRGAAQIDDILVHRNGTLIESQNFEGITPSQPGEQLAFGNWSVVIDPGTGDFAQIFTNLGDADPCAFNISAQMTFIDDGIVVPGTGGTLGQTWTYGPGGYIINVTGGLMGPEYYLFNGVISPVVNVPSQVDGVHLWFDVYRHEELGAQSVWPGVFYYFSVRSVNTGNPADLESASWTNFNFVYYGGPNYLRSFFNVTGLMAPGRTHMQASLSVYELGWVWGWVGTDGTPAPYFDNVAITGFPFAGPTIVTREIDLFQDNFPASGVVDWDPLLLGNNSIRLDMARNITPSGHAPQPNTPGDTIILDIQAVRAGYVLAEAPRLYFAIRPNPLFAAVRDLTDPTLMNVQVDVAGVITGYVDGLETFNAVGAQVLNRWNFDLPDVGFFWPGDIMHYYVEARDILGGDPGTIGTTRIPGNLDYFGDFDQYLKFSSTFTVRGLPTMFAATPGAQPKIMWWNDFDIRGGENEWLNALANIGYQHGVDFDMYYTNGPSSNVGNGLGGRALPDQIAGYDVLLYTAGNLSAHVLGVGVLATEPGNDVGLLTSWFEQGGKKAFMTGDDLVTSLISTGGAATTFLNSYLSVNRLARSILSTINNQTAPLVLPLPANGVIDDSRQWIAYGGCFGINTFDGVEPVGTAQRLAYFTPPSGSGDPYPYAAATRYHNAVDNAIVVYMPYDFMYIQNAGTASKTIPVRALILQDILQGFGQFGGSAPTGVTPDAVLAVSNYPNPFNPSTTIKLTLPRTGDVSLKVFNVRGELVRTLVNGSLGAGVHDIVWDGTTDKGNQAASGVYFFQTNTVDGVKIAKGALVK